MPLNKFILITTLLSIFTESFVINVGVDLKFFYLVILLNFFLITLSSVVVINIWHLAWISFIFLVGVFKCEGSYSWVVLQAVGIAFVSFYYYNFFRTQRLGFHDIFSLYAYLSYLLALVGILIFVFNLSSGNYRRLESLLNEPAHYVAIVLPAMYYYWRVYKVTNIRFLVIFSSVLLAGSSVGFIGLLFAFVLSIRFRLNNFLVGLSLVFIFALSVYSVSDAVKMRVDDTYRVLVSSDLTGVNLSTFAFMSNLYVAMDSFSDNPLLGGGLGSHQSSRDKYLGNIKGVEAFEPYFGWNAKDANSFMLRLLSEQGVIGILLVLLFLFKFGTGLFGVHKVVSRAILIYILCKLLREGHYFPPEMYFFVIGYFFNYIDFQSKFKGTYSEPRLETSVDVYPEKNAHS